MITPKTPKNAEKFICEECDFKCSKQSDYNRHLSTRKHQMIINGNTNDNEKAPKIYMCDCGKQYNFSSGLSRHKQKCNYQQEQEQEHPPKEENTPKDNDKDKVIDVLLKRNDEMQNLVLLLVKMHENQADMTIKMQENQADMTKNIDSIKNLKQK